MVTLRPSRVATHDGDHAPGLPDEIRGQHLDLFGWEHDKEHYVDSAGFTRWRAKGWTVITSDGIHTYNLDGIMVRDRVIYA